MTVWIVGGEPSVRDAVAGALRETGADAVESRAAALEPREGDSVCDLGRPPAAWAADPRADETARAEEVARRTPAGARIVRASLLGADPDSRVALKAAHGAAEQALAASPAALVVMRVGVVLGACGLSGVLRRAVERSPVVPVPGIHRSRFEPLALPDFAAYLAAAATADTELDDRYDLGCGEMLTGGLFVASLAENLGLRRAAVPVPTAPGAWALARFADEHFPARAVALSLRALASGLLPRRINAWEDFTLRPLPLDAAMAQAVGMQIPLRRRDEGGRFGWVPPKRKGVLGLGSRNRRGIRR